MITLLLDGKQAALPKDFSFEFTVENPYFTDAAEYTGEVPLTPKSIDNIKIFGATSRFETTKNRQVKEAILKDGNTTVLEGKATTIEYTPDTLNIQLLGGNSAINFMAQFEDMYIDDMKTELGALVDNWNFFPSTKGEQVLQRFAQYIMAEPEHREWVMLPAKTNLGNGVNTFGRWFPTLDLSANNFGWPWPDFNADSETSAIQPRICAIVRRVITALGYEVGTFDAEQTHLKYLYYVNVVHTRWLSEMLPHWNVSTFLDEIQKLFGCVFVFDTINKVCDIKSRANFFSEDIVYLEKVDDDFNVSMEEAATDIGNSNLIYNTDEIPKLRLFDEEIYKSCEIRSFDSVSAAEAALRTGKSNLVANVGGHFYIWHTDYDELGITPVSQYIEEVNDLGALYDPDISDQISLNIVPAKMDLTNSMRYVIIGGSSTGNGGWWPTPSPTGYYPTKNVYVFDVDAYVHQGEGSIESNSLSIMPVAFFTSWDKLCEYEMTVDSYDEDALNTGASSPTATFELKTKLWSGWTQMIDDISKTNPDKLRDWETYTNYMKWSPCCALRNMSDYDTIYSGGIASAKIIETTSPHVFNIYDEIDLANINKTYVIRGVKYVCAKVECTISSDGISKVKKGTFYRID